MVPSDGYPGAGSSSPGGEGDWPAPPAGGEVGYCVYMMRLTGQTYCAYCGIDFTTDLPHWLLMTLDPIVPPDLARSLGLAPQQYRSPINYVLACSGCSRASARYRPDAVMPPTETSLPAFLSYRDRFFADKQAKLAAERDREAARFYCEPWTEPVEAGPASLEAFPPLPEERLHAGEEPRRAAAAPAGGPGQGSAPEKGGRCGGSGNQQGRRAPDSPGRWKDRLATAAGRTDPYDVAGYIVAAVVAVLVTVTLMAVTFGLR